MCAEGHRPICQDTGIAIVFLKVGMDVRWDGATMSVAGHGQRRRAPRLPEPGQHAARLGAGRSRRRAQEHQGQHAGRYHITRSCPATRSTSSSRPRAAARRTNPSSSMLNPSDSHRRLGAEDRADDGRRLVPAGILGIGIGGTAEKAMLLAKESLMEPVDMHELQARGPRMRIEELRLELYRKGQRAGHRRARPGRPDHRAGREDHGLPHPRRQPAGRHDPQLRRHAPRPFHAGRQRPGRADAAQLDDWPKLEWTASAESRRVNLDT